MWELENLPKFIIIWKENKYGTVLEAVETFTLNGIKAYRGQMLVNLLDIKCRNSIT